MKSRITKKFRELKKSGKTAFIPFITAGDPHLKTTEKLIYTLEAAGAAIIELGVPFTDPMADGPVIQQANERALKKGTTLAAILKLVKTVRRNTQIPLLLMGYYNPILQYGLKKFVHDAQVAGVDGLLIVDLPAEESQELRRLLKSTAIDLIFLLTPTSDEKRIKLVKKYGSGFVYYVSLTGITGSASLDIKAVQKQVLAIRAQLKTPLCVGFGISKPEEAHAIAQFCDGVVVGSAIVKMIAKHKTEAKTLKQVGSFVRQMV